MAGGGAWFEGRNLLGCPPRPEAILHGVAFALGLVPKKVAAEHLAQEDLDQLATGPTETVRLPRERHLPRGFQAA